MESKKQVKIKQLAEEAETQRSKISTFTPSSYSNKRNDKPRTADEYYADQINAIENKNYKVELLRQQVIASEPMQKKPEINKVIINI